MSTILPDTMYLIRAILVFAMASVAAGHSAGQELVRIRSSSASAQWAYDHSSGRLFWIDEHDQKLCEVSAESGKRLKEYELDFQPEQMLIKNQHGLIRGRNQVALFDLRQNKVVRKFDFDSARDIFLADPTSPFAYVFAHDDSKMKVIQIDLTKAKRTGELNFHEEEERLRKNEVYREHLPRMVKINHGFYLLDENRIKLTAIHSSQTPSGVGNWKIRRIIGQRIYETMRGLYTADWKPIFSNSRIVDCRLHSDFDLFACLTRKDREDKFCALEFRKISDQSVITRLELRPSDEPEDANPCSEYCSMFEFDEKRSRLVIGQGGYGFVVEFSKLREQLDQQLILNLASKHSIPVNHQFELPIEVLGPTDSSKTRFSLHKAPDGVEIKQGKIQWLPKETQLGQHRFELKATDGKTRDALQIEFQVDAQHVRFNGKVPTGFTRSPDGKYLAVMCYPWAGDRGSKSIFVVDLEKRKVVSEKTTIHEIKKIWMDNRFIYYASSSAKSIYRFPFNNSKKSTSVRIPIEFFELDVVSHRQFVLAIVNSDNGQGAYPINRDTFTLDAWEEIDPMMRSRPIQKMKTGDAFLLHNQLAEIGDRIVDTNSGKIHCLLDAGLIPKLIANKQKPKQNYPSDFDHFRHNREQWPKTGKLWARRVDQGKLTDADQNVISELGHSRIAISNRYPLGATLHSLQDRGGAEKNWRLRFYDLVDGELRKEAMVPGANPWSVLEYSAVDLVGDQAIVIVNDRMTFVSLDDSLKKLTEPLRIQPPQISPVELVKKSSIQLDVRGTGSNLQFELINAIEGISIDNKTGQLMIDGPKLLLKKFDAMRYEVRGYGRKLREKHLDKMTAADRFGTDNSQLFKFATGYELSPRYRGYVVPISVKVTSDNGHFDQVRFAIPLLIPIEFIDRYIRLAKNQGDEIRPDQVLPPSGSFGKNRGKLMLFADPKRDGSQLLENGKVISEHDWLQYHSVFSGGEGVIYAVSHDGNLLYFRADKNGAFGKGKVISKSGWNLYRHVFAGGNGTLYAVTKGVGKLMFFKHQSEDGNDSVTDGVMVGAGGWAAFKFLFSGGDGVIYAVENKSPGRLLRYVDKFRDGSGPVGKPIELGVGWKQFQSITSDGENLIYAVNKQGKMLFYRDLSPNGGHSTPKVIGTSGWKAYRHVFSGGKGIIYTVPN